MTIRWPSCHSECNVGISCSCLKLGFFSEQLLVTKRCHVDQQAVQGAVVLKLACVGMLKFDQLQSGHLGRPAGCRFPCCKEAWQAVPVRQID